MVELPAKVDAAIRRQAREAWPKETIGFLLGRRAGTLYEVEDLWVPPDIQACRTSVTLIDWHPAAAAYIAENDELEVLGAWHSHPRPWKSWKGWRQENTPSAGDHKLGWEGLCGICAVIEKKNGGLETRLDWFPPSPPVEVIVK
jgi:proteasome lid subunit RPN8/RPN11